LFARGEPYAGFACDLRAVIYTSDVEYPDEEIAISRKKIALRPQTELSEHNNMFTTLWGKTL
jgi:hypothetical protein